MTESQYWEQRYTNYVNVTQKLLKRDGRYMFCSECDIPLYYCYNPICASCRTPLCFCCLEQSGLSLCPKSHTKLSPHYICTACNPKAHNCDSDSDSSDDDSESLDKLLEEKL